MMLPVEICRKSKAKIFYFGFRGNYFSIQVILEKFRIIIGSEMYNGAFVFIQ